MSAPGDAMRQRLVDAALSIVQRHGAAALTVRNITELAGCSTTGVYTYFGGKDGIVDALFVDGFESFDAAVTPGLSAGDLVAAARGYRAWALAHTTQYLVMFGGAVAGYEPSPAARDRAAQSFQSLVAGIERVGPPESAPADIEAAAYHFFATIHGHVMLEISGMSDAISADEDVTYDRAVARLMAGLSGPATPAGA